MRRRANVAERWTLLQALAWVITRDQQLVDEIGTPPAADAPALTLTWLIVRATVLLKRELSVASAWRELSEGIVAGSVRADGQPEEADGLVGERQRLSVEARDLVADSERFAPRRECFLAPQAQGPRIWLNVEVSAHDVQKAFPASGVRVKRGGRKPVYDQDGALTRRILAFLDHHGSPHPLDAQLPSENALVMQFIPIAAELYGQEPSRSTLLPIVKKALARHVQSRQQPTLVG